MALGAAEILVGLSVLLLALYYYLTSTFDFWKKRNVPGPRPIPIFGNFKDVLLGKIHSALLLQKFYNDYKNAPLVGIFARSTPFLVVRDPDLIKDVLIRDFNVFPDRGRPPKIKNDPSSPNLVNLEHERWRPLRNKLSPVFTSGKLKDMVYLIAGCAERLEDYVEKLVAKAEPVECRDLTAKFTTDSIGVCAFGLNTNTLEDENSEFRRFGRVLFETAFRSTLRRLVLELFPRIYDLIAPLLTNPGLEFFAGTIKQTVKYRRENKVRRNDFVDLLLDLQDQPEKLKDHEFTDKALIAQSIVFFAAGFETSSTTMSNILYELALNPDVQDKLREDIRSKIENDDGKFTYDNIKSMKYLDKVMKETLRKYPPGSLLQRMSVAPYTFKGTGVSIPENTFVFIPVWAMHRDPLYFPDPDKFDPERFNEENEKARHPMAFLPFGDGPHNCIGSRFAIFQTKIGIAALLKNFKVEVCDKTCNPYRIKPRAIVPTPVDGIVLMIKKA